jgi:serine/threonine protein kinase
MGVVYRAKDTKLDRIVALKFIPNSLGDNELSRQRFMIEARAAAKLTHANICAVYEIDEHVLDGKTGQMFMVMECIEGVTLKDRLEEGKLPVETAVSGWLGGLREPFRCGLFLLEVPSSLLQPTSDRYSADKPIRKPSQIVGTQRVRHC